MIAWIWWLRRLRRERDGEEYAPVEPDAAPALPPIGAAAATRQVGAASYTPVVRGGYALAPEDDPYRPPGGVMSASRRAVASSSTPAVRRGYAPAPQEDPYRSILRRPVGAERDSGSS